MVNSTTLPAQPQLSARSKLYSIESLIVTHSEKPPQTTKASTPPPSYVSEPCRYATTPLLSALDEGQTHSPQLPAPSPNYPVQTHALDITTPEKTPEPGQQQRRHVPNTDVPTHHTPSFISDNDAPRKPSQTDVHLQPLTPGAVAVSGEFAQNNNNHEYINYNSSAGHAPPPPVHDNSESKSVHCLKTRANAEDEPPAPSLNQPEPTHHCNNIDSTETQETQFPTFHLDAHVALNFRSSMPNGYVLNVPTINRHSVASSTTSSRDLLAIRRSRSKLDLAAKRRRLRRELRTVKSKRLEVSSDANENKNRTTFEYGVKICGYSSESSSSDELSSEFESDLDVDLWIRKGPPSKLRNSEDKNGFLNIFGLTTHQHKNEIELKKMERRKWAPPLLHLEDAAVEHTHSSTDRLDLPVPFESPSLLNLSVDFLQKVGFLNEFGLRTMHTTKRQELEKNWMKVVEQRIARNALTPLNGFYQRFGEKILSMKEKSEPILLTIPKFRDNGMQTEFSTCKSAFTTGIHMCIPNRHHFTDCSTTNVTNVLRTIPHATLYSKHQVNQGKHYAGENEILNGVVLKQPVYNEAHLMHAIVPPEMNPEAKMASARQTFDQPEASTSSSLYSVQACITNVVKEMISTTASTPTTMTIIEVQGKFRDAPLRYQNWSERPGIKEMMAVYTQYSKARSNETTSLRKKCEANREVIDQLQAEVKRYEARQSELRKIATTCRLRRQNMEKAINRFTKIVEDLRTYKR